jgi:hypothetical protein
VVALALLLATAACSKSGPQAAAGRATTTTEVPVPISFTVTSFDLELAGDPAPGALDGAKAGVEALFQRWLDEDVLPPLRSAGPAGDVGALFTPTTGQHVITSADRAAFVSEGLPPVTGLAAEIASLALVSLIDPAGNVPAVSVHLELKLQGTAEGTPLTVEHTGDFVLVEVEGFGWRIDSYDTRATRVAAGGATTTTARS